MSEGDVLVISVPKTDQTIGLSCARELAFIKRSAILINVGRGPAVSATELNDVHCSGRFAGAALDVWKLTFRLMKHAYQLIYPVTSYPTCL